MPAWQEGRRLPSLSLLWWFDVLCWLMVLRALARFVGLHELRGASRSSAEFSHQKVLQKAERSSQIRGLALPTRAVCSALPSAVP